MALKQWSAIVAACAFCALAAVKLLQPREGLRSGTDSQPAIREARAEKVRLEQAVNRARAQFRDVAIRQRAQALLANVAHTESEPRIAFGSDISQAMRESVAETVRQHWSNLAVRQHLVPVATVVVTDTAADPAAMSGPGGAPEIRFFLPDATQPYCLAVVRLKYLSEAPSQTVRELRAGIGGERNLDAEQSIAGPCAYFAAHGAPGGEITKWLHARGYDVAMNSAWNAASQPSRNAGSDRLMASIADFSDLQTTNTTPATLLARRCRSV